MKKILLSLAALCMVAVSGFAQNLDELLEKYSVNQSKIETFIARGTSTTTIMDSQGGVIRNLETTMSLFLKRPNKLKLITDKPVRTTFVQQGDYVTQKIDGQGGAVTTKADEKTNFLQFYFSQDIPGYQDNGQILEQGTVVVDSELLYRFKISIDSNDIAGPAGNALGVSIDAVEVFFNSEGMTKKTVLLSGDTPVITSEVAYIEKEGIFLPQTLFSRTESEGMIMESVIHYTSVNVNVEVLDKEFYIY